MAVESMGEQAAGCAGAHLRRVVNDEGVGQVSPQHAQVLQVVAVHEHARVPEDAVPDEPPAASRLVTRLRWWCELQARNSQASARVLGVSRLSTACKARPGQCSGPLKRKAAPQLQVCLLSWTSTCCS